MVYVYLSASVCSYVCMYVCMYLSIYLSQAVGVCLLTCFSLFVSIYQSINTYLNISQCVTALMRLHRRKLAQYTDFFVNLFIVHNRIRQHF